MASNKKITAALLRLGTNNWLEEDNFEASRCPFDLYSPRLRCDRALFDEYTEHLAACGVNTLIIDLGDGLRYESHPEIAVEGAWAGEEMKDELSRLRALGFEVIPMLNFSGAHDIWLGDYAHMIATVPYYRVCTDLINEVCDIFEPRFVHIGMNSETFETQKDFFYTAVRHKELWWHDVYFLVDKIIGKGARAIIYADRLSEVGEEAFFNGLPQSVVVSEAYDGSEEAIARICSIDQNGYDQLPICISLPDESISDEHFLGCVAVNDVILDESRREDIFKAADEIRA